MNDELEYQTPFSGLTNKSKKIKDWYGVDFIEILSTELLKIDKAFNIKAFQTDFKKSYAALELKERLILIANLIEIHFPGAYKKKLTKFKKIMGKPWPKESEMMNYGFFLYPLSQFVEINAEKDLTASLDFIEELTKRFTGEWAIRTVANADKKLTLASMKKWSTDSNFHVRRLASEGLRARLPWGKQIDWINKSPELSLPIYNKLRNDPVLYVRRSVANSMGDMIKINDDLAYNTLNDWLNKQLSLENLWVVKHAIRTPRKKGEKKYVLLDKKIIQLQKELKP